MVIRIEERRRPYIVYHVVTKRQYSYIPCVIVDGKVIVVGGMGVDTKPKDYLLEYDAVTDKWMSLPAMPTPRYATFTFLINDNLYVIGL